MIVVVANRLENHDCSKAVDSAELVIRIGKMCNLDSGKTGTRTDWCCVAPSDHYWQHDAKRRHWEVVQKAKRIFIRRDVLQRRGRWCHVRPFVGLPWEAMPLDVVRIANGETTTAQAIHLVELMFPDEPIGLAGGDIGQVWIRNRNAPWHAGTECSYYDRLIASGKLTIL